MRIRQMSCFIIWSRNSLLIQYIVFRIEYTIILWICVPTGELITSSGAKGRTDFSSIWNTEVHLLVRRTPVKCCITCWHHGVQENTILNLLPLREDCNTVYRHCCEWIRNCTAFICIPALKDISFFTFWKRRLIILIFISNDCALPN